MMNGALETGTLAGLLIFSSGFGVVFDDVVHYQGRTADLMETLIHSWIPCSQY